jgi:methyl-accepting chemotaxis protein
MAETMLRAAQRGTQAMERMTEAIQKIKASAKDTANIIRTIDEIRLPDQPAGAERGG